MPVKKYKPTSPAKRQMTVVDYGQITKKKPEKSLLTSKKKTAGRNSYGRITSRARGGGNKQKYRIIDWKRNRDDIPATVKAIEYDPNRTAFLALIQYADGVKAYILAPHGLKVGDQVMSGPQAPTRRGNAKELGSMPNGTVVHNVELRPGAGAQMVKSAGAQAQIVAKEGKYVQLRLPSGEVRLVPENCRATVGQVGNVEHENVSIGKAGKTRHMGRRPGVRGVAMNPVDHPHGGGEGRSPIGRSSPVTPWGQKTLGKKTRRKNKDSNRYIVRKRK